MPVTIHYNDGTSKTDKRTCVVGESYNYISTESGKQFSSLPDPKREGYNFKGWFTEAEGGAQITNQYKFTGTDPVTLYAHWARAVTVTFDANGGNCYTTSKVIDEGSGCTLTHRSVKHRLPFSSMTPLFFSSAPTSIMANSVPCKLNSDRMSIALPSDSGCTCYFCAAGKAASRI